MTYSFFRRTWKGLHVEYSVQILYRALSDNVVERCERDNTVLSIACKFRVRILQGKYTRAVVSISLRLSSTACLNSAKPANKRG